MADRDVVEFLIAESMHPQLKEGGPAIAPFYLEPVYAKVPVLDADDKPAGVEQIKIGDREIPITVVSYADEPDQVVVTSSVVVEFSDGGRRRMTFRTVDGHVDMVHWEGLPPAPPAT